MPLLTQAKPDWLLVPLAVDMRSEEWSKVVNFFVFESPCGFVSARGISLAERGWKHGMWGVYSYLKAPLDEIFFGDSERLLFKVENREQFLACSRNNDFGDDFACHLSWSRALFVKRTEPGCSSSYMSLFYHLRNSLAHGRFSAQMTERGIVLCFEDGKLVGAAGSGKFEVTARIVLTLESLAKAVDYLSVPPSTELDYESAILELIDSGINTKTGIVNALEISGADWKRLSGKLRLNGKIRYVNHRHVWLLSDQKGCA